ncbi:MAG: Ig-like domain-containing protein [Clostridia bacterium]|nr:Ig-like domain-containing protein [Clostridia bacterium]
MKKLIRFLVCLMLLTVPLLQASAATVVKVKNIGTVQDNVVVLEGSTVDAREFIKLTNISKESLEWSSSDDSIATVNNYGIIKGVSVGNTFIKVAGDNSSATLDVIVAKPVHQLMYTGDDVQLATGTYTQVYIDIQPEDASFKTLEWSSTNERIAVVDEKGTITAVSPGRTNIIATATDGSGVKTSIPVVVKDYDLVFTSKMPQKLKYYRSGTGKYSVKGSVKNGNVSIPNIDMEGFASISGVAAENVEVTPCHPGTDVVTLRLNGKNYDYTVFVADYFEQYYTQYRELVDTSPNESNGSFQNIIYGTSYSDVKDRLEESFGNDVEIVDSETGFSIVVDNPELEVAGHPLVSIKFDFCYDLDRDGNITKDMTKTCFYRGEYVFSQAQNDGVADNIHSKLKQIYGDSDQEKNTPEYIRKMLETRTFRWSDNDVSITLETDRGISLEYVWSHGLSKKLQLNEIYNAIQTIKQQEKEEAEQRQYSTSTDGL